MLGSCFSSQIKYVRSLQPDNVPLKTRGRYTFRDSYLAGIGGVLMAATFMDKFAKVSRGLLVSVLETFMLQTSMPQASHKNVESFQKALEVFWWVGGILCGQGSMEIVINGQDIQS